MQETQHLALHVPSISVDCQESSFMTAEDKKARRTQYWVRFSGVGLAAVSVYATYHVGWLSVARLSSLENVGLFLLSLFFLVVVLILTFWIDIHFHLLGMRSVFESEVRLQNRVTAWDRHRFMQFVNDIERGADGEDFEKRGDLRIVTTHFSENVIDLGLNEILKNGVRIKMLMMDPTPDTQWGESVPQRVSMRHGLRMDGVTPDTALADMNTQIAILRRWQTTYPYPATRRGARMGTLEIRLYKHMPSGFVAHSERGAIVGLFPSHCSYTGGPMIMTERDSVLWTILDEDWKTRWDHIDKEARAGE
jgi:hypothetical protein